MYMDALIASTYPSFETIMVDDGSTDSSVEKVAYDYRYDEKLGISRELSQKQ